MNQYTGKLMMLCGLGLLILGLVIYFLSDKMQWFGQLPGDIRIEKDNFRLFFPLSTMIILSVLLNLVIWLVRKFLN
jgi:uncharacterized protein HemY